MAARCEAAGRFNNEDNFQLADNLSTDQWSFVTDNEVDLGEKGALLIVCDGMGGASAGEVASKIAVETIKEWFSADRLTGEVITGSAGIIQYIEKAIVAADARIKEEGQNDMEKEGMGSTIVLAWIIGQSAYIAWCGDSRAYCFNPADGLKRLSHDHSYVQTLVDSGQLSEELAFNHPNNNIITRCLGDMNQAAKPEVREYPLHDGDIVMLCSDGLNGVLRDSVIEMVMSKNTGSMATCRDALWDSARDAGWNDNVTIGLCRIVSGCEQMVVPPAETQTKQKHFKKRILRDFFPYPKN
jgi:serine/threonine protein phosphatase PrpC